MKLSEKFDELKSRKEGALVAYICVGDPTPDDTKKYVTALIKGGADIIELGLPFSDPVADGPIIQASIERALNAGMTPDIYFETVSSLHIIRTPLVLMTYYNILLKKGILKFVQDCKSAGISGMIIPDLPIEESEELRSLCTIYDIDLIFMVTPTTTEIRMKRILSQGTGFIYIVGNLGVTGMRSEVAKYTHDLIGKVKANIPKVVGFGISNGDQAAEIIHAGADGVIVGSAFVDIIAENKDVEERLESLAKEFKERIKTL